MITRVDQLSERCSRSDPRVLKAAVDRRLDRMFPVHHRSGDLEAAIRYSVLAPGKRVRPLLTLYAAWELGPADLAALDAGCALELIHTASLILDDLPAMDDALERRGQPATHVRFGEDVALLSAIALLNQAYAVVGTAPGVDAEVRCGLIAVLAKAVGTEGLTGGQHADLRQTRGGPRSIVDANHRKTGALFVAAVEMAAAIRRATPAETDRLRSCAAELGQAFQLLDDLIDSQAFAAPGRQEDAGKATLLTVLGRAETRRRLDEHVAKSLSELRPKGALARFIGSIFENGLVAFEAA